MSDPSLSWATGQRDIVRARIARHEAADEIVQNLSWDGRRGCAIGCSLDQYSHALFARVVTGDCREGRALARLVDCLHESISPAESVTWARRFTGALEPGTHPRRVLARWFIWLLTVEAPSEPGARVAALWQRVLDGRDPSASDWWPRRSRSWPDVDADEAAARHVNHAASYSRQSLALLDACRAEAP